MNEKIKILHLEDSHRDAELIQQMIEIGGISNDYFLTDSELDFREILETEKIDIILSDYHLPDYDGDDALTLIREKYPQIPFIFVSGKIGEDAAINAMVNGATDYVLKNRLERLVPAIKRARNELELESNRKRAEIDLRNKSEMIEKQNVQYIQINKKLVLQNAEKEKLTSELIIARDRAEESDRLKTAFLQNMSHEIRTPLNGIIGFSGLLNNDDLSKEEIKEFTDIICQSGNRLIEIVNNVLDISRIQTGQVEIRQKPILINSIFSGLLSFFHPLAHVKNICLEYHNQGEEHRSIISDETKLHQILTNLINNAIKFTKSGNIDYGFEIKEKFVQFYVQDTGIGIRKELYDKIFERFIQAEQTTHRSYEGAGLGLAISKGLVELLGGNIWVESEINKGTTFFFTIPSV